MSYSDLVDPSAYGRQQVTHCFASATSLCVYEAGHDGPCSYNRDAIENRRLRTALEEAIVVLKAAEDFISNWKVTDRQKVLRLVQAALVRAEKAAP